MVHKHTSTQRHTHSLSRSVTLPRISTSFVTVFQLWFVHFPFSVKTNICLSCMCVCVGVCVRGHIYGHWSQLGTNLLPPNFLRKVSLRVRKRLHTTWCRHTQCCSPGIKILFSALLFMFLSCCMAILSERGRFVFYIPASPWRRPSLDGLDIDKWTLFWCLNVLFP